MSERISDLRVDDTSHVWVWALLRLESSRVSLSPRLR